MLLFRNSLGDSLFFGKAGGCQQDWVVGQTTIMSPKFSISMTAGWMSMRS